MSKQNIALRSDISIIMTIIFLMPHRGFEDTACFDIWLAAFHIIEMLYDSPFPTEPQNNLPTKAERNAEIRTRYQQGEPISQLATTFGISEQRVWQILRGQRN
jgi:hypothetical protein